MHEHIVEDAGLKSTSRVVDGKPCPKVSDGIHIEYVDNFIALSTDKTWVEQTVNMVVEVLESRGLPMHEISSSASEEELLGWDIAGKETAVRPARTRLWKVRLAIRSIVRHGKCSGRELERVVGHMSFISLINRPSLSVFNAVYSFISRHYNQYVPIWTSVRRELEIWDGISPLLWYDMSAQISTDVTMSDACETGGGVVIAEAAAADVEIATMFSERWRFDKEKRSFDYLDVFFLMTFVIVWSPQNS